MNYRIAREETFDVVGKSIRVTMKQAEDSRRIPQFWDECTRDGTIGQLQELSADKNLLGICMDVSPGRDDFTYMIAVRAGKGRAGGFATTEVPTATWAVFESIGPLPEAIQKTWKQIFSEGLPAAGFKHTDAPELEIYPPGDVTAGNYRCEVWIPIVQ